MGLLEMGYSDPTADLHVEGVCVDFDRFLADLESVAGTTDDKCEDFPTEAYHAHMEDILTEAGLGRLKLPLLFSVVLDEWLSFMGSTTALRSLWWIRIFSDRYTMNMRLTRILSEMPFCRYRRYCSLYGHDKDRLNH